MPLLPLQAEKVDRVVLGRSNHYSRCFCSPFTNL